VWWRVVETMFSCQFNIKSKEKPKTPIEVDLFTGGQILTYEYRNMLKQGKVKGILGAIREFKEKSVVLQDGTELEADMVIYGTGFKKNYDFIERLVQEQFQIERDGLWLYRNILPVGVPNMAFIGCEVSTFNNILTHGLQAKWLAQLLSGEMDKPAKGTMMKTIEKEQAWKRSWMPPSSARAAIWQLHMLKYHDNLCKDMGVPYKRKGCCLPEVFAPYTAADYKDLFGF
jgi:dimethylaniline monooxygenase (N-oxide forming)